MQLKRIMHHIVLLILVLFVIGAVYLFRPPKLVELNCEITPRYCLYVSRGYK